MLTSISPVGEQGRGQRWTVTVGAYVLGSLAGGALTGAALGGLGQVMLGWVSNPARLATLAMVALVGLTLDARRAEVPTWRRQVDEDWLTRYRGWVYGLGFGFQLGLGVVTIVTSSTLYVMLVAALLTASPVAGLAIGVLFGLSRSLPLSAMWWIRSPAALLDSHRRLSRWSVPAERGARTALVVTAVFTGVGAVA